MERELGWILPNNPGIYAPELGPVKSVEVIDDYTVKVTLEKPFAPFFRGVVGSRAVLAPENYDEEGNLITDELIGTGPYKLVELVLDDYAKFERREDSWVGVPNVKTIIFKQIPDPAVRLSALQNGDIDIMVNPTPEDFLAYQESPSEDYFLGEIPGSILWAYNICLNSKREPFDDIRVRQAIAHAIDVDEFIAIATGGIGKGTTSAYAEGSIWFTDVPRLEYDLELAKSLLEEAGYPDGFETTIHTTDFVKFLQNAQILQAQLGKIGIKATINKLEMAEWAADEAEGNFDIHTCCWNFAPDPTGWYDYATTDGAYPTWFAGGLSLPEMDEILNKASEISDFEERAKLYKEANEIQVENVQTLMLYTEPYLFGQSSKYNLVEWDVHGLWMHEYLKGIPNMSYK